jgi:membrane protein DedA with SNARE-associated domain
MSVSRILQFVVENGYLLLFVWILAEQAALPLPSFPLLLVCGALARTGELDLTRVVLCGFAACLIADNLWFALGRRHGAKALKLICRLSLEPDSGVRRTEHVFLRYGLRSLLVSKFLPGLNAVAAPIAGSSGATIGRFILFDALGALLWIMAYVSIGYIFGDRLETAMVYAGRMGSGLVFLVGALLGGWIAWKFAERRRLMKKLAVERISADDLRARLRAGDDVLIVDLRSDLSYSSTAFPSTIRIPAEELPARHHEIPRDREVVLFCS